MMHQPQMQETPSATTSGGTPSDDPDGSCCVRGRPDDKTMPAKSGAEPAPRPRNRDAERRGPRRKRAADNSPHED